MPRKVVAAVCLAVAALATGLFLWVRAVFTDDIVRSALASQLSSALGQPVTIGGIGAGLYPRVTVNLKDVAIGEPARIRVRTLHVGASLGALLSRRIEHARLELADARIELPLPPFAFATAAPAPATSGRAPVELVSVDAVVLRNVEVISGGRSMTGDIDVVPEGRGATIRKVRLRTDDATIDVTGQLTDLSGPAGTLSIKAGALNFDRLLAFANAFAAGSGMTPAAPAPAHRSGSSARPAAAPMNVAMELAADRATIGTLVLDKLSGKARLTNDAMRLDPIDFGVFGGHYNGSLAFRLSDTPDITLRATLAGVDVAAATRFAGSPGTISGTLSGRLNITGRGLTAASLLQSAHGGARLDIVNGVVNNLGLVRNIVVATSGRADAGGGAASRDEPFSRLGTTLTIAGGSASTTDLRFESPDLLLGATGTLHLDGSSVNLAGRAQLSEELSRQAGRDLVRYTQEGGRVTLPVTVTGSAAAPHVRIDVADAAKRAVVNRATEEGQKTLKKALDSLFKR